MTRGAMRATHLTLVKLKRKEREKKRKTKRMREEERERENGLYLLSTIYGDRVINFWWTKNYSRSTRQGLRVDTRNSKFRRGFAWEVREVESFGFRKYPRDFLETLLTLQEVGILTTLVYFPF